MLRSKKSCFPPQKVYRRCSWNSFRKMWISSLFATAAPPGESQFWCKWRLCALQLHHVLHCQMPLPMSKPLPLTLLPVYSHLGYVREYYANFLPLPNSLPLSAVFWCLNFLTVYYKICYKKRASVKQETVLSVTSFYLCPYPCFGLILVETLFRILMFNATKQLYTKHFFFFLGLVLCINLFLKIVFFLTYMAIYSQYEFRLKSPEFLQPFDKCDNLCYKYIKARCIFEYQHSIVSILSRKGYRFFSLLLCNAFYV